LGDDIVLYSIRPEEDEKYGLNAVVQSIAHDQNLNVRRYSLPWLLSRVQTKLTGSIDLEIYNRKKAMFDAVRPGVIAFSIGGDNYCYPGTDALAAQNSLFRKKGAKTVLWGCSVEPELTKDPAIAKDLARYDLITARETISYEALKAVNPNTVLVADPAFTLERKDLPLPTVWVEGKMVGINASPLILDSGDGALVMEAYRNLIRRILDTTDMGIVLVPHVTLSTSDDHKALEPLFEEFRHTGRVLMLGDHNCMELKGYIARCRLFIGARTHSTIAAYSQLVPTLVLGYSVKSRGIARDLFGSEEHYVIPVQGMTDPCALANGFDWLLEHETEIRSHLEKIMPGYKEKAYVGTSSRLFCKGGVK
jgi:polysaccharide pyruvyl transferase WcaK-like protein